MTQLTGSAVGQDDELLIDEPELVLDMTAHARVEDRHPLGRDLDEGADGRRWHRVAFCAVSAGWSPLSVIAWMALAIAVFGWDGNGSFHAPTVFEEPTAAAAVSIGLAVLIFGVGAVVLGALARWAVPGPRRVSVAIAAFAVVWAPVTATVWSWWG